MSAGDLDFPLGARRTFVQFSSAFCRPCSATRQVLERVAATTDGVVHVELDVAAAPGLAEAFEIAQTPTVLVLDASGSVLHRLVGVPSVAAARAVVAH